MSESRTAEPLGHRQKTPPSRDADPSFVRHSNRLQVRNSIEKHNLLLCVEKSRISPPLRHAASATNNAHRLLGIRRVLGILDVVPHRRCAAIALCLVGFHCYAAPRPDSFQKSMQPFFVKNCYACHNDKLTSGGLNLKAFQTTQSVLDDREHWETVVEKLKAGAMPPKGVPRPDPAQVALVTKWFENEFAQADRHIKPDPGRVTARRLNRVEYDNTIRDLFGVNFKPADDFPADDYGYGFDNIGDVLSLSPVLMEKYLAAAEKIAKAAIFADPLPKATVQRFRNEDRKKEEFELKRSLTFEADYEFRAGVAGRREPQDIVMSVDSKRVKTCPLSMDPDKPRICDLQVHLAPGEHAVTAMLIRDESVMSTLPPPRPTPPGVVKKPPPPAPNPTIDYIETRGPYKPSPPPLSDSEKRIFACGHARGQHTPECSRMDVAGIARLAYRRPVTLEEVDALVRFVDPVPHRARPQPRRSDRAASCDGSRIGFAAVLFSVEQHARRGSAALGRAGQAAPAGDVGG